MACDPSAAEVRRPMVLTPSGWSGLPPSRNKGRGTGRLQSSWEPGLLRLADPEEHEETPHDASGSRTTGAEHDVPNFGERGPPPTGTQASGSAKRNSPGSHEDWSPPIPRSLFREGGSPDNPDGINTIGRLTSAADG